MKQRSKHTAPASAAEALAAFQRGDLAQAETLAKRALAAGREQADALHLLGMVSLQRGQPREALEPLERCTRLVAGNGIAWNNLGNALLLLGRHADAADAYRRAVALLPAVAEIQRNLGQALRKGGLPAEAAACYRQALALKPDFRPALENLGEVLAEAGSLEEAAQTYSRLGEMFPDNADAFHNLGTLRYRQRRLEEAAQAFAQAIALRADFAQAHFNLGVVRQEQGRLDEAIACYEKALALNADYRGALNNLGTIYNHQGRLDEAASCHRRLLALKPDDPGALNNLGAALKEQGQVDEAIRLFRRALAVQPDYVEAFSNMLLAFGYSSRTTAEESFREHLEFARRFEAPLPAPAPFARPRDPERRPLRIGYVAGDFRNHPLAVFMEPLLARHDRANFRLHAYVTHPHEDFVTLRLKGHFDAWRSLVGLTDDEAAALIRADGIDVLVDLSGHTGHHRLLVFARKPAPVQVSYLGYGLTTGLKSMDYLFTDAWYQPPEEPAPFYTETLWRLPVWRVYRAPEGSPEVGPLPALANGHLTFGSFNNFAKVTDETLGLWADILAELPTARLLIVTRTSEERRRQVEAIFAAHGVAAARIEWQGKKPFREYLGLHGRVDVALDPFPFNGATTNFHSVWMGVPFVTLRGDGLLGRSGVSVLGPLGLHGFVARDKAAYRAIAVALAGRLDELAAIRGGLRERMRNSALMDENGFARAVEDAYATMWRRWCTGAER